MGMKKSNALASILMMGAMMSEGIGTGFEQEPTTKRMLPKPTPLKPFKEQDGIVKLIQEYKLILQGKSKKGKLKQGRTVSKINEFIDKGYLSREELNKL